jgi:hypothetical protein
MATLDGKIVLFGGAAATVVEAQSTCPPPPATTGGAGGAAGAGGAPGTGGGPGMGGGAGTGGMLPMRQPAGPVATPPPFTTSPANDTWEWDGQGWLRKLVYPTTSGPLLAEDGKALFFDGTQDLRWEWDGVSWTALGSSTHPPFRYLGGSMAVRGDRIVFFGGLAKCGWPTDTWEWDGTSWSVRPTQTSPPGGMGHAMASLGDKLFLFGGQPGVSPVGKATADTWEWDGATWTKLAPPVSPPARTDHAMVTVGNKIVLFGGTGVGGTLLNDTWEWDGSTWTPLTSPSSPPARSGAALATWNKTVILFGGTGGSDGTTPGFLHDTWALTGGTWTQLTPMTYPWTGGGPIPMASLEGLEGEVVLMNGSTTWLLGLPAQ